MSQPNSEQRERRFIRLIGVLLVLIFFAKLSGFFSWSTDVNVTRVVKVASRIGMTAAIFAVYRLIIRRGAVAAFQWRHRPAILLYGGYLLLGLVSFLWSTNIGYSALQWVMDVESLVFAYYFICCFILLERYFPAHPVKLHRIVGHAVLLIMLIFLIGAVLDPLHFNRLTHGGEEIRLGGDIMNPNELGMLAGVGISCFLFDVKMGWRLAGTLLKVLLLLIVIYLTGSRSSAIGVLLIAFFHIRQSAHKGLKWGMYLAAALAVPVTITEFMIKEGGIDEVLSMTGRLPFWKALITEGLPRELMLGYGFMRIDYRETFESVHTYAGHMTHNTFIQVLMNLGVVGLTLAMTQFVCTLHGAIRIPEKGKRLLLIGILIPVLINSFTEFGIFGETNFGILFYQLLIFYTCLSPAARLTPAEQRYLNLRRPEWAGNGSVFRNGFRAVEENKFEVI